MILSALAVEPDTFQIASNETWVGRQVDSIFQPVRRHRRRIKQPDQPPPEKTTHQPLTEQETPPPLPVKRPVLPEETPTKDVQSEKKMLQNVKSSEPTSEHEVTTHDAPYGPVVPPSAWPQDVIQAEQNQCHKLLDSRNLTFEEKPPLKEGACGTAAPIELHAFGRGKASLAEIYPAALTTCTLAAALSRWFDEFVQPKAKSELQATIVKLTNASSYVCRNRYDSPMQRISQHAYANAIDIGEFITAKGETISVLDHWHGTDARARFLHAVHDGACEIFGTTLGPDSNAAHNNHFHVDMTERHHNLCDFTPRQLAARQEEARLAKLKIASQEKVVLPDKAASQDKTNSTQDNQKKETNDKPLPPKETVKSDETLNSTSAADAKQDARKKRRRYHRDDG